MIRKNIVIPIKEAWGINYNRDERIGNVLTAAELRSIRDPDLRCRQYRENSRFGDKSVVYVS